MSVLARVAVDASAALAAVRSNAFLGRRQGEVRDSPWASDRDFRSAMAEPERRVLPERLLLRAHPDVRELHQVRRLRDAWQKVACRMALQFSEVLLAVRVLPLKALSALRLAQVDESELLPARSLQAQHASRPDGPPLVREPAPWAPLEQRPRALPAR
jgi:hypothetical protein